MYNKNGLPKKRVQFIRLLLDLSTENERVVSDSEYAVHESRATRLVGDSRRFMTVAFTKNSKDRFLAAWLDDITEAGKFIAYDGGEYVFLGYTENNLKSGHVLFFREGADFTVEELKDHFGNDLKAVYETFGYGKYAARLGLSFSSTVATEEIEPEERHLLPDLTADDGSLTSDGCGLIRDSYARDVSVKLGLPFDTAVFQMRLGGIKGTLTRCPDDLFDRICGCLGKKIAYRRSMVKYNGGPHILEIQSVSKAPKSGRLNKQFIVLLLTLGIPLSVFEELLQMQLDEIDKITTDRGKALDCVEGEIDAEADGFYQELYEMLLAGHDMNEPYLASQLRRFQTTARDSLRKKLNISLKGSGYLLGVVDHCDVLKEGEVYINLPTKGGPQVGPVATMRNPAYDPNGIRVLEAVNRPELKHLTNCIVFAASGSHSETDRMGGGDLDGDLFFTIFNPALIPEPRALPTVAPKPVTRSKTIAIGGRTPTMSRSSSRNKDMRGDAIQTFVRLRCNFLLGSLSNEWIALVGTTPALADHPLCMKLVPMIEEVLDIVKTGGNLAILRNNFDRLKTQISRLPSARDWTNPLNTLTALVPQAPSTPVMDFTPDEQLVLRKDTSEAKWEAMVKEAERIMPVYNRSLQIAIEADKEAKLQGLQEDEKRADLMKADMITEHFPPVQNILEDTSKYLLKASVWYFTGYKHGKQSFAWLGARWLNYIKASQCGLVPISVGARSTSLLGTPRAPPTTPPRAKPSPHLPPTPVSMARPSPPPASIPVPLAIIAVESDFEVDDNNTDPESDEFEFIGKESAYDTALEDLVPLTTRLRIDTTPRRIARENSDDTLVDIEPESRTRPRARALPSPTSPFFDVTARPPTRGQGNRRLVASPEPLRADANVTITRPRTRAQTRVVEPAPEAPRNRTRTRTRAVSPTPASKTRTRAAHTHSFLIQPNSGRTRVCVCGVFCTVNA